MAARHDISHETVARIWRENRLKPWRFEGFELSNDPGFEAKVVDVVALYMDPPARAVVARSVIQPVQSDARLVTSESCRFG